MINHSDGNNDNNNTNKENEKIIRYKDLEIEIQRIVTPVVAGTLGMIKKNTDDHIKRIPRRPLSARIAKDSTEWDGSFTATCTIHVTEYTVLTQSEDQHYRSATVMKCMKLHLPLP